MAKILVVENFVDLCLLLEDALRADGHQVITAHNGAQGLDQAITEQPDLILTDMKMPIMTGEQMITILQSLTPTTLLMGMSADVDPRHAVRERNRLKIHAFIAKPFDLHHLRRTITALLEQRGAPIESAA